MKVVEFPDKKNEEHQDIQEFFDNVKVTADENSITDAVVIMMNDDGEIGISIQASIMDAMALLTIAQQKLLG